MKQIFFSRSRIWIYKKSSICCLARSEFIRLCTKVGKMKPPTTFNFSKRKFSVLHTKWPSLRAKSSTRYLSACMFAAHACLTNFLLSSHPRTQPAKTRKKNANFRESELFAFKKGQREILFWCCESTWLFSDFKFLLIYFFCHIVHNLMMLSTKGEIVMEKLFLTIICLIS